MPGGKSGGLDQAMLGSAPNASRSAARRNTRASRGGATAAVAAAAVDTAIPAARHTASTSRLAATASGSATSVRPSSSPWCGRCARGGLPARARTTDGPAPSHNAMASNTAAALTTLADR
ncbi:Uncharacterised protein [Mycobacterium tuberculosis]|nr:Uncharacterised protein [Mycobacterium tuberculosis]